MSSNNPEEESQDLVKLRQGVVLLLAKANMQSCVLEAEKSQEEEKRLWKPESLRFPQKETAESWNLQSVPFCEQSDGTLVPAPHCFFLFRVFFFFFNREVFRLVRNANHLPNQVPGRIQGNRSPRPLLVGVLTHRLQSRLLHLHIQTWTRMRMSNAICDDTKLEATHVPYG